MDSKSKKTPGQGTSSSNASKTASKKPSKSTPETASKSDSEAATQHTSKTTFKDASKGSSKPVANTDLETFSKSDSETIPKPASKTTSKHPSKPVSKSDFKAASKLAAKTYSSHIFKPLPTGGSKTTSKAEVFQSHSHVSSKAAFECPSENTCRIAYQHFHEAFKQQQAAVSHLKEIAQEFKYYGAANDSIAAILASARRNLDNSHQGLHRLLETVTALKCDSRDTARGVRETFGIPELFEHILSFLPLRCTLQAERVNKQFFYAIRESNKIQRQLGFLADDKSPLRSILMDEFDLYAPFYLHRDRFADEEAEVTKVTAHAFIGGTHSLPRVGQRLRSMLAFQPHVKHMDVLSVCCNGISTTNYGVPVGFVHAESGVTVGDILDTVARVRNDHRLCPNADFRLLDDEGYVVSDVSFIARFPATKDDPVFKDMVKEEQDMFEKREWLFSQDERMQAYAAGKQVGTYTRLKGVKYSCTDLRCSSRQ